MSRPSYKQAQLLANVWSRGHAQAVSLEGNETPTVRVCVREGWLEPLSIFGTYPNGSRYELHGVSDEGRRALGEYLVRLK